MKNNKVEKLDYVPIDCTLYDNYAIWADRKLSVIITSIDDSFLPYDAEIKDLVTKDKKEYLVSDKNLWHRVDRISVSLK